MTDVIRIPANSLRLSMMRPQAPEKSWRVPLSPDYSNSGASGIFTSN